jgi:hypothetical protein
MIGFFLKRFPRQVCGFKEYQKKYWELLTPLRQKFLKTLQNEAIFPLITMNVWTYASNHFN